MNVANKSILLPGIYAVILWATHIGASALSTKLSMLPIEGTQHTAHTNPLNAGTKIYALLAESKSRSDKLENSDFEAAFQPAVAPVAPPPAKPEPPKPTQADLFKQQVRITGLGSDGVFLNGKYVHQGEKINTSTRLVKVYGCIAQFTVGGETVNIKGTCK